MPQKASLPAFKPGDKVRILSSAIFSANGQAATYVGRAPDGCHLVKLVMQITLREAPREVIIAAKEIELI